MSETPPPTSSDTRFLVIAMALMVVVTALLAGLWLNMRLRAIRAERELARLKPELRKSLNATAAFERLLKVGAVTMPVDRESLPAVAVKLDGRDVKALELEAGTGASLGFAPGDVIIVRPPPPATSTAPAAGG